MKPAKAIFTILAGLTLTALLSACGASHTSSGEAGLSSVGLIKPENVQAFASTLYSFGQAQNCTKCHASVNNPLWMNPDVETAYAVARPFVDMNNPTASLFATYAGNNHCQEASCADPANRAVVQNLLSQWAGVELASGNTSAPLAGAGTTLPNPTFVTATMPIPSPLPLVTSPSTPAVIRFDLSRLTPAVPALSGAILEISVQSYNSAYSNYKVFNPRIVGNTAAVEISGIHVYVRPASGSGLGVEDINQGLQWSGVSVRVPVTARPSTLPTGPMTSVTPLITTSVGIQAQSAADALTVGFAVIQ